MVTWICLRSPRVSMATATEPTQLPGCCRASSMAAEPNEPLRCGLVTEASIRPRMMEPKLGILLTSGAHEGRRRLVHGIGDGPIFGKDQKYGLAPILSSRLKTL